MDPDKLARGVATQARIRGFGAELAKLYRRHGASMPKSPDRRAEALARLIGEGKLSASELEKWFIRTVFATGKIVTILNEPIEASSLADSSNIFDSIPGPMVGLDAKEAKPVGEITTAGTIEFEGGVKATCLIGTRFDTFSIELPSDALREDVVADYEGLEIKASIKEHLLTYDFLVKCQLGGHERHLLLIDNPGGQRRKIEAVRDNYRRKVVQSKSMAGSPYLDISPVVPSIWQSPSEGRITHLGCVSNGRTTVEGKYGTNDLRQHEMFRDRDDVEVKPYRLEVEWSSDAYAALPGNARMADMTIDESTGRYKYPLERVEFPKAISPEHFIDVMGKILSHLEG